MMDSRKTSDLVLERKVSVFGARLWRVRENLWMQQSKFISEKNAAQRCLTMIICTEFC